MPYSLLLLIYQKTIIVVFKILNNNIRAHKINIEILRILRIYPKVLSIDETINCLVENKFSISRFGDGEFTLMQGKSIPFQKYDRELAVALKQISKYKDSRSLVAVVDIYSPITTVYSIEYWSKNIIRNSKWLARSKIYGNANVFRSCNLNQIYKIKELWNNRNILFIIGLNSRFIFDDELFENANSFSIIHGSSSNAYSNFSELFLEAKKWLENRDTTGTIVLISLGPTATVLAQSITDIGFQALDIGHITNQYYRLKYGSPKPENI